MSARFWQSSLRTQLVVLLIALSLVPLAVSNIVGYLYARADLTRAALSNVRNVARAEASRTAVFVRDKVDLVAATVAGNRALVAALRNAATGGGPEDHPRTQLNAQLIAKVLEHPAVEAFAVRTLAGELVGAAGGGGKGQVRAPIDCGRFGRGRAEVAGFSYVRDEEPTMRVAAPIRSGGRLLGVLCAGIRFDIHHSFVEAHLTHLAGATVSLLDGAGRAVCGSEIPARQAGADEGHAGGGGHHEAEGHAHGQVVARPRLEGEAESWAGRYVVDGGREVIGAVARVPPFDWRVVVEVPVALAVAGLRRFSVQAATMILLLAGLVAVGALVIARRLSAPLARLSAAASRIAAGRLGEQVPADGPAEVRELSSIFNRMSDALDEGHRLLERRVAERTQELRRSQRFAELLLDAIDPAVVVVDRAGTIIRRNAAAGRLWGRAFRWGEGVASLGIAEEDLDGVLRDAFDEGRPGRVECSMETPAGQQIAQVSGYPVPVSEGEVDAVVLIVRLVTGERRMQAQMLHQEKMAAFGLLAAGMAHDIGNPLAAIQSQLQLARVRPEAARTEETLRVVEEEVARIARMLRDMVSFARRKRDQETLADPNRAVEDVARLIRHDLRARSVEITCACGSRSGVRVVEDHLVQVLLNLGLNALDAMPDGGRLAFETRDAGDRVILLVRDTGHGLDAVARERLFEPFFTTKPAGQGTGLGLFVSRTVISDMGGELDVAETSPRGTTMRVTLPAVRPEELA